MKKLLFLISIMGSLSLISCQKDEKTQEDAQAPAESVADTTQKPTTVAAQDSGSMKKDSVAAVKAREMQQNGGKTEKKPTISTPPDGKGTKGDPQKSGEVKSAGEAPSKDKGTVKVNPPTPIKHGADEQAKIDSIKKAKGKDKK